MRNKIKAALVALVASAGIIAAPVPASAAVADCPLGSFCIWIGYNFTSTRYTFNKSSIDAGTRHGLRLGVGPNNRGRSFYNHTTTAINIYDNGACGYSPWTRTMSSGDWANAQGSDWPDRVSAIQIEAYAPNC